MAHLVHRANSHEAPRAWSDWDPFRSFFYPSAQAHGLDITRDESGVTVEIPVAGFKPDQIDVTLDQSVLTVSGKSEKRQFSRSLLLPEDIDSESINAKVEDGLLTLTLGYHAKAQPRKIEVHYRPNPTN